MSYKHNFKASSCFMISSMSFNIWTRSSLRDLFLCSTSELDSSKLRQRTRFRCYPFSSTYLSDFLKFDKVINIWLSLISINILSRVMSLWIYLALCTCSIISTRSLSSLNITHFSFTTYKKFLKFY